MKTETIKNNDDLSIMIQRITSESDDLTGLELNDQDRYIIQERNIIIPDNARRIYNILACGDEMEIESTPVKIAEDIRNKIRNDRDWKDHGIEVITAHWSDLLTGDCNYEYFEVGNDPEPPKCKDDNDHKWKRIYKTQLRDIVIMQEECIHCNVVKETVNYGSERNQNEPERLIRYFFLEEK